MTVPFFPRNRGLPGLLCAAATSLALAACQGPVPDGAVGGGDVDAALAALESAPAQGLAADGYGVARLRALSRSHAAADRAARDRGLHAALVAYARAEHGLDVPPSRMPRDWALKPAPYDAEAALRQAVAQHRFRAWLAEQPPASPAYRALQQAYVSYLKIADAGGWPMIASGGRMRPGDPRAEALRHRLAFEDPALAQGGAGDLSAALGRFQAAHGLPPTGVLDAATLQELNVPAKARAAQIRANLERLRWLPRDEPATRVEVNTAAGLFDYYREGRPMLHMLAAAGKPGDETPMLTSAIDAVVLNPPWNIPEEIAKTEIYPKAADDPDYLAAHGYEETSDGGGGTRLVQKPGAESALGLVKFDFKNPFSVYLHDTPSKAAFARSQRSVSHGCVRLAQAMAFAKLLLSADAGWPPEKVDQVIASGQTTSVPLKRATPVRLVYLTAFPDGGRIAFRPDVYGWDAQMLQLMDRSAGREVAAAPARQGTPG